ncbi:MAG: hypothetical protein IJU35_08205 [Paludibacteraceae bacterium]|nr:hypothetical protein [Paludibacteraceae bacterium]
MFSLSVYVLVAVLLLLAVAGLSVGILLNRKGGFPNSHVSGNEEMRRRGIGCAQSQDRQARQTPRNKIDVNKL